MGWWNLPNAITLGRIALALVVAPMILSEGFGVRLGAFLVFLVAAFSDLWDGHLARSQGLVTDFGKLMDPLADKLLLVATFVPFYLLSHGMEPETPFPWFNVGGAPPWEGAVFPLWVLVVIFGRELFITVFRGFAARRGVVLAAGKAGKMKAVFQNIFIGATILWYALQTAARERGWDTEFWSFWQWFHFAFTATVLLIAVALTVFSLYVYLRDFTASPERREVP